MRVGLFSFVRTNLSYTPIGCAAQSQASPGAVRMQVALRPLLPPLMLARVGDCLGTFLSSTFVLVGLFDYSPVALVRLAISDVASDALGLLDSAL